MPLHIKGLDESAFKTLAKRYRAQLSKKNPTAVPSLSEVQEDLARAFGYKDLHAAQAYWAAMGEEEETYDERNAFAHIQRSLARERAAVGESWKAGLVAMPNAEDFQRWLATDAFAVLEMRQRFRAEFNLLLHAIRQENQVAINQLLESGDEVSFNDLMAMFGSPGDHDHRKKSKPVPPPTPAQFTLMVKAMTPLVAQEAVRSLGLGYNQNLQHPLSPQMALALFERSGGLLDDANLRALSNFAKNDATLLDLIVSRLDNEPEAAALALRVAIERGFDVNDRDSPVVGLLLQNGDLPALQRLLSSAAPVLVEMDERAEKDAKAGGRSFVSSRERFFSNLLSAAIGMQQNEAIEWSLQQSLSPRALGEGMRMSIKTGNMALYNRLHALGGVMDARSVEFAARDLLQSTDSLPPQVIMDRLEVLLANHPSGFQVRFYGGGSLVDQALSPRHDHPLPSILGMVRLLQKRGVDINQGEKGAPNAFPHEWVANAPEELRAARLEVLLDAGWDPAISARASRPAISLMLDLADIDPLAGALVQRMGVMPGVFDRIPERRHPLSCIKTPKQGDRLLALGAQLDVSDVAHYIQAGNNSYNGEYAATKPHRALLEWAMDHGVDCTQVRANGSTLLHLAASKDDYLPLLDLMLSRGVDIKTQNAKGQTVLDTGTELAKGLIRMRQPASRPRMR